LAGWPGRAEEMALIFLPQDMAAYSGENDHQFRMMPITQTG